jgi:hypothetical protein
MCPSAVYAAFATCLPITCMLYPANTLPVPQRNGCGGPHVFDRSCSDRPHNFFEGHRCQLNALHSVTNVCTDVDTSIAAATVEEQDVLRLHLWNQDCGRRLLRRLCIMCSACVDACCIPCAARTLQPPHECVIIRCLPSCPSVHQEWVSVVTPLLAYWPGLHPGLEEEGHFICILTCAAVHVGSILLPRQLGCCLAWMGLRWNTVPTQHAPPATQILLATAPAPNLQVQLASCMCYNLFAIAHLLSTVPTFPNEEEAEALDVLFCDKTSQLLTRVLDVQLSSLEVTKLALCGT